jgi:hypothetical protein
LPKAERRALMIIITGFIIAGVGAWIEYLQGGSLFVAIACSLFAGGNILLIMGAK